MAYQWARWLPDVLRAAGCTVIEEPGWSDHGHSGTFEPRGVMLHHDASPKGETSNGADVIIDGRPDLPGPLAQLWLDYDGRWHVCAAGRAYHAGEGQWGECPRDRGNDFYIGVETDHTTNEQWTGAQRSAALAGVAAIMDHLGGRSAARVEEWFCAHKEYAAGRKVDPDPLDMGYARDQLRDYTGGDAPVQTIQKHTDTVRTLVHNEWRNLKFTDADNDPTGQYAMGRGPAGWFELTVQVTATGTPGTRFYLRPLKEAGEDDIAYYNLRDYEIGADGKAYVELTQAGSLADGKWLRVDGKVHAGKPNVTLTLTRGQAALW